MNPHDTPQDQLDHEADVHRAHKQVRAAQEELARAQDALALAQANFRKLMNL